MILLLLACGRDDILVAADEAAPPAQAVAPDEAAPTVGTPISPGIAGQPTPGVPAEPTPGAVSPGGIPTPGVADAGAAGVPAEPTPGIPPEPTPAPPGTPQPNSGPQVALSGTVAFSDYKAGTVRITVFDGDHSKPSATPPKVLGMAEIPTPGPFTVQVPEGVGKVYLEASIDEDLDGRPGPQEPQGQADRYPVTAGTTAVTGLSVALKRREPPKDGGKRDDF